MPICVRPAGTRSQSVGDLVATTWLYVTDDPAAARRMVDELLAPLLRRDPEGLAANLPIGSVEHCARVLGEYGAAGAGAVLLWPLRDPLKQIEVVAKRICPLIGG
jgi:hypothetical protein